MTYVATINVPGYLPMDDEPPTFSTAQEAWQYLLDERKRAEDELGEGDYSETVEALTRHASEKWLVADFERAGSVHGDTPGYDGNHDLGLVYAVTEVDPIDHLAGLLLGGEADHIELLEALKPLLDVTKFTRLCDACEVCPLHIHDAQICRDDHMNCPAGRGE